MARQLIDPRLRNGIPDHWPSLASIVQKTYSSNAANERIVTGHTPVAGLTNIPCRKGSNVKATVDYDVKKRPTTLTSYAVWELILNTYYPDTSIDEDEMLAIVDGQTHLIRGSDNDSQHFMTRLLLQQVT